MSVSTSSRLSGSFSSGFAGSGSGVSSGGSAASSPGADGFASGGFSGSLFCPPQAVSSSASSKHTVKILRFIPFTPRSLIRCHANTRKIQDLHWFRPWPKPDAAHGYIGAGFQRKPQCHKQAHLYMLIISIPCGNSSGPHRSPASRRQRKHRKFRVTAPPPLAVIRSIDLKNHAVSLSADRVVPQVFCFYCTEFFILHTMAET